MSIRVVIATPHPRYDSLVDRLNSTKDWRIERVTSPDELTFSNLSRLRPDYVFFPHWSSKIPAEVYEHFPCVIFHMADVPYGRGGSPLQNLIRRGHRNTMLSALRCVEALDAGPVYLKQPLSLLGTAEEIFGRAAELMETMIVEIAGNRLEPLPQVGEPVVFKRLRPEDGDFAEAGSLEEVFDAIRSLDAEGYPPAFVRIGKFRFEFSRASLKPGQLHADVRIRVDD